MILSIRCDKTSFKTIEFKDGFNVILAERTDKSKDNDSRNGLGKSLLVEIIHFCLGSNIKEKVGLGVPELDDWTFILDMTLQGKKYSVSRNTKESNRVIIEGDFSSWPIKPEKDEENNYILKIREWTTLLGYLMFEVPIDLSDEKYTPTFRSLFSYFCRRGIGGYQEHRKHYSQQQEWDIQVNNAYLLGLNWEYASKLQKLKDQEKLLGELKQAAKQGLLKDFVGSIGELEALKVNLKEQIEVDGKNLKSFKVHPQYYQIQADMNILTEKIHNLLNDNNISQQILEKYKENIGEEKVASYDKVKDIYEQVGIVFSDKITKRLDDVEKFVKEVIKNRKEYLDNEIKNLEQDIEKRHKEIETIIQKRSEQMAILSTHGALEEYSKLQERHTGIVNQLKEVEGRIGNIHKFEEGRSSSKIEKEQLLLLARRDLQAREAQKSRAIKFFNDNSQYLYAEAGLLSIDFKESGFKYDVEIKRSGSHGIEHMKVFCYDLSLIEIWSKKKDIPGFLFHDSIIFDGVDERQIARALELAKNESEDHHFQYICTLNSDMIPKKDLDKNFDISKYVVGKFTDATDDGGLLGIRF
jgi:uncharacterized protein YydD (DUF2326 family)